MSADASGNLLVTEPADRVACAADLEAAALVEVLGLEQQDVVARLGRERLRSQEWGAVDERRDDCVRLLDRVATERKRRRSGLHSPGNLQSEQERGS